MAILAYKLLKLNIGKLISDAVIISNETADYLDVSRVNTNDTDRSVLLSNNLSSLAHEYGISTDNAYYFEPGSNVSFRVIKKFFQKEHETVKGTTKNIEGVGIIDNGVANIVVVVDPKTFITGVEGRDREMYKFFSSDAIFIVENLPIELLSNETFIINTIVPGKLMVNGIEKFVEFKVKGNLSEGKLVANGSLDVNIVDLGVTPPSLLNVYSLDDTVTIDFSITAVK